MSGGASLAPGPRRTYLARFQATPAEAELIAQLLGARFEGVVWPLPIVAPRDPVVQPVAGGDEE
jgi:hypothetical protein